MIFSLAASLQALPLEYGPEYCEDQVRFPRPLLKTICISPAPEQRPSTNRLPEHLNTGTTGVSKAPLWTPTRPCLPSISRVPSSSLGIRSCATKRSQTLTHGYSAALVRVVLARPRRLPKIRSETSHEARLQCLSPTTVSLSLVKAS